MPCGRNYLGMTSRHAKRAYFLARACLTIGVAAGINAFLRLFAVALEAGNHEGLRQMARIDRATTLRIEMTAAELAVFKEMQRREGACSAPNLIRTALWSLAEEMALDLTPGVFDQRHKEKLPA